MKFLTKITMHTIPMVINTTTATVTATAINHPVMEDMELMISG